MISSSNRPPRMFNSSPIPKSFPSALYKAVTGNKSSGVNKCLIQQIRFLEQVIESLLLVFRKTCRTTCALLSLIFGVLWQWRMVFKCRRMLAHQPELDIKTLKYTNVFGKWTQDQWIRRAMRHKFRLTGSGLHFFSPLMSCLHRLEINK